MSLLTARYASLNDSSLPPKKPFGQLTWSQIKAVADAGYKNSSGQWCVKNDTDVWFEIFDEKQITMSDGEVLTVMIYDFEHDDKVGGGKASITIGLKNLMKSTWQMNTSYTNVGGWDESYLRKTILPTLYAKLPTDLKGRIVNSYKKATAGGGSAAIITSVDNIWLFADGEVRSNTSEGTKYPVFTDNASRIKYQSNGTGPASFWWLRSPRIGPSGDFYFVDSSGNVDVVGAFGSYSVCFGFCI